MKLKLIQKNQQVGDVVSFVFESEENIDWQPGQYMHYLLRHKADERGDERWFTISNAPFEKRLAITTRILPTKASSFKSILNKMPIGSEIEADGPKGKFVIDKPNDYLVLIAGGIGITPFRSILLQAAYDKVKYSGVLLYINHDESIVFKNELEDAASNINISIQYIISPDTLNADAILESIPNNTKPYFYISGPEPMVEHYEKMLLDLGFAEEQLKKDYFPGYVWPLS